MVSLIMIRLTNTGLTTIKQMAALCGINHVTDHEKTEMRKILIKFTARDSRLAIPLQRCVHWYDSTSITFLTPFKLIPSILRRHIGGNNKIEMQYPRSTRLTYNIAETLLLSVSSSTSSGDCCTWTLYFLFFLQVSIGPSRCHRSRAIS